MYTFGNAVNFGSLAGKHLDSPVAGIVASPDGKGYWLVAKDGGVFSFGSAQFYNPLPGRHIGTNSVVGMAASASSVGVAGLAALLGSPVRRGPPVLLGTRLTTSSGLSNGG